MDIKTILVPTDFSDYSEYALPMGPRISCGLQSQGDTLLCYTYYVVPRISRERLLSGSYQDGA